MLNIYTAWWEVIVVKLVDYSILWGYYANSRNVMLGSQMTTLYIWIYGFEKLMWTVSHISMFLLGSEYVTFYL